MKRKIFKSGHSLVLALSKNILDGAGLKEGDSVEMEVDKDNQAIQIKKTGKTVQLAMPIKIRQKMGK
jgi:antitoxin component of MazEF toxin-antitoxin module